jgi:esterase/lipase superfamily enzyme
MSLGQAIVTVPKAHGIGQIKRPSYWSVSDWLDWMRGVKEDPRRHFTIPKKGIRVFETPEQFITAVLSATKELPDFKDHAFVYVHGFTVQFDDALYRLAQLSYDLGVDKGGGKHVPFGLPFLFSWPTIGGIQDYVTDSKSARYSEGHLRDFLDLVVTKSQAKNVHLIAHSMGSELLLQVMKDIASAAHPNIKFNQVILAAPDVDKNDFIELAKRVKPIATNVTLYASSNDEAMIVSRAVHSGRPRAGDVPKEGPVVLKEVHTIDASELSTSIFWTPGHSKYAEDTLLLKDIGTLVRKGTVPPHDRTLTLGRIPVGEFWYWFFPRPKSPFG